MNIPAWLIITMHLVRGFVIAFLTAIVAGPLDAKLTWIASIGGGIVGAANSLDTLRTDPSKNQIVQQKDTKGEAPAQSSDLRDPSRPSVQSQDQKP